MIAKTIEKTGNSSTLKFFYIPTERLYTVKDQIRSDFWFGFDTASRTFQGGRSSCACAYWICNDSLMVFFEDHSPVFPIRTRIYFYDNFICSLVGLFSMSKLQRGNNTIRNGREQFGDITTKYGNNKE